jgi:hypothetical protein
MHWFRLYNRMVDDEKLRLLAFEDRWHFVALCCLCSEGLLSEPDSDLRTRKIAVKMGVQVRELEEVSRRLREVGLIDESLAPLAWDELQYRSDTSTARVKKYREKQRCNEVKRSRNVAVTPQEIELETELESSEEDRPSDDGPALTVEEVFEGFKTLMSDLGLPVPRDLTPERRQLLRFRVAQYPLEDFQTVFGKCRDSPFLRGDKGRTPLKFDWLFKKANFQKVLEGNYD